MYVNVVVFNVVPGTAQSTVIVTKMSVQIVKNCRYAETFFQLLLYVLGGRGNILSYFAIPTGLMRSYLNFGLAYLHTWEVISLGYMITKLKSVVRLMLHIC